jgi:poly(hydroxyalkanoate) granule-associated protein
MSTTTERRSTPLFRLGELPRNVADRVARLPREIARDATSRGREVWLAGLGALATAGDEGTALFQGLVRQGEKLVERGGQVEEAGRARIGEVRGDLSARQKEMAGKLEQAETELSETVLGALKRFGVPTRGEVEQLSASVATLTERVEELLARLDARSTAAAPAVYTVAAREEGWAVEQEGLPAPLAVYATQDEALERARALASEAKPSRLVVLRRDGTVQDTFAYEA